MSTIVIRSMSAQEVKIKQKILILSKNVIGIKQINIERLVGMDMLRYNSETLRKDTEMASESIRQKV